MRLIDADALKEKIWRSDISTREKISNIIDNAPTVPYFTNEQCENAYDEGYEFGLTARRSQGRWIYDKKLCNWKCSECGETPKTIGYVGNSEFMKEHFKYCNHCGAEMIGEKK